MTPPSDPEAAPEPEEEEPQIVLRLSDILPRVPAHFLKPGPHDATSEVRFSVDELAEKMARGRVSVPLGRLASVYPEVFRDSEAFPGEQEIQLPLQKLLEQVGLTAPKHPASNGAPSEQIPQPRTQAEPIVEPAPSAPAEPAFVPPLLNPLRIAKAISTARQILGRFGRTSAPPPQAAIKKGDSEENPYLEGTEPAIPEAAPAPQAQTPVEPAQPSIPPGCISLRVLPIFRLLSPQVLRSSSLPSEEVRLILPLSAIESQIADGHVEIPLDDFITALPEDLREAVNPVPEMKVWIPLDEIFQSLPPDHLFYMPPFDATPKPADFLEEPTAEKAPQPENPPPPGGESETAKPAESAQEIDPSPGPVLPQPMNESSPEAPAQPAPPLPDPAPEAAASPTPPGGVSASGNVPPAEDAKPEAPAPEPPPAETAPPLSEPSTPGPPPAIPPPSPSPSPWMRGFQVPPPLLFTGGSGPAEPLSAPAPADPVPPPPPPPTPEAKRTVDFLASQPGVFAAAAFVEGAVFASADFPRKPDLDALRDFMGAFVGNARESGPRLGWNRILTIACEQFHVTAVVRESHFIVALHHDRVLPSIAHDALIAAADDLDKAAV